MKSAIQSKDSNNNNLKDDNDNMGKHINKHVKEKGYFNPLFDRLNSEKDIELDTNNPVNIDLKLSVNMENETISSKYKK